MGTTSTWNINSKMTFEYNLYTGKILGSIINRKKLKSMKAF